jgi:hypothetical protein
MLFITPNSPIVRLDVIKARPKAGIIDCTLLVYSGRNERFLAPSHRNF